MEEILITCLLPLGRNESIGHYLMTPFNSNQYNRNFKVRLVGPLSVINFIQSHLLCLPRRVCRLRDLSGDVHTGCPHSPCFLLHSVTRHVPKMTKKKKAFQTVRYCWDFRNAAKWNHAPDSTTNCNHNRSNKRYRSRRIE